MLLGQVLEVSLGERDLGSKDELVAYISAVVHHEVMDCRVSVRYLRYTGIKHPTPKREMPRQSS